MDRRQQTLATLVRWREFQHAKARSVCQVRAAEVHEAERSLEDASERACNLQAERADMLTAGVIDLGRLGLVSELEDHAWADRDACVLRRSQAIHDHARARAEHLEVRARLNVAHAAYDRIDHEQRQAREKHEFDQLMDLLAAGRAQ
jgi:hypothetical protein